MATNSDEQSKTNGTETYGSASATLEACLKHIDDYDHELKAMITVVAEKARAEAAKLDALTRQGVWLGPLHGMPIALKDNISTKGLRTTHGSRFFRDHVPQLDAEVVRRIKEAGAIIIGKNNMHEFAFGATNQNPHYGSCRNPWDLRRLPGGSSGGSAVALASGMCVGSIGTDSGGSVRIPASFNGVCALRPTAGRVSIRGATAASSNFATVAPMARRMTDVARLFSVMDGYDRDDPNCVHHERQHPHAVDVLEEVARLKIGIPTNFFFKDIDSEVKEAVLKVAQQLKGLGATLCDISIPEVERAQTEMTTLLAADAAAYHRERLDKRPELFGDDVKRRLLLGRDVTGEQYSRAFSWRKGWSRHLEIVFSTVDLILTPTVGVEVPLVEGVETISATKSATRFTYAWSMAGVPSISMPCGYTSRGMPIGVQIAAGHWQDYKLLDVGRAYQLITNWHLEVPPNGGRLFDGESVRQARFT